MQKKECIAMLLAGGQGSRLGVLTKSNAKPAVSFGGKYRIIDFSLSNCVNSGIDTVGVLIQYRPLVLNRYLGTGEAWDLDSSDGGVHVLPPYATETGGQWYAGTADAIYHNIDFIDSYNPEYVLILSGDHLYKMNYDLMLEEHKAKNADLTVSVIEVPWEEASRFGIMTEDEEGRIVKFSEKPKNPDSNLASMGIYIFSWPVLRKALLDDHMDPNSDKDFGKNIIPRLLSEGRNLFTYHFNGYWKDVGTIDSYYDAQFDLMDENSGINVYDNSMRIFSNSNIYPPHFIGENGVVSDSLLSNGCVVEGEVNHSILGSGVVIEEGCVIEDSIILPGVRIGRGSRIVRTIVNEDVTIKAESVIGEKDGEIAVIGAASEFAL
ncbi:MAG: glucose-1-phosphate adenylyltransferase [Ruminococcaceae bacterium]|nr:glucose-1-phosphate adenylyltransferase [Oscillospiraceae bacterium]